MFYVASQIAVLLILCAFIFYALGRYVYLKGDAADPEEDEQSIKPIPKSNEHEHSDTDAMPRHLIANNLSSESAESLVNETLEKAAQISQPAPVFDDTAINELTVRLAQLEELIQNLKLDSEMALLAQIEFQEGANQVMTDQAKRSTDLEHEVELRITQTDREIATLRSLMQELDQKIEHFHEVSKKLKELIDATRAA